MSLEIVKVSTPADLNRFVSLPWKVYAHSPLWVPNLKSDDRTLLTPGKHPFWETAHRELFLALRDGEAVGRIAAIVDEKYNEFASEKCGAFGFFECLPDPEAPAALLRAAYGWLKEQGMRFMRGPLNPSTNYTCGLLVDGFDEPPAIMMPWNPPEYASWFAAFNMRKEKDLFAYRIDKKTVKVSGSIQEELDRLKGQKNFTYRASSKATLAGDAKIMLQIYRESWSKNFGFVPLSPKESDALVKELVTYLDPQYFVLFFHGDDGRLSRLHPAPEAPQRRHRASGPVAFSQDQEAFPPGIPHHPFRHQGRIQTARPAPSRPRLYAGKSQELP